MYLYHSAVWELVTFWQLIIPLKPFIFIQFRTDVVIAKVDATENEIEGVEIQGFPTLKLWKKGTNEEVDYNGTVNKLNKYYDRKLKLTAL